MPDKIDHIYRVLAVAEIADLVVEISKDRTEIDDPARRIYSVFRDLAAEIGERLKRIRKEQREKNAHATKPMQ